MLHTEGGGLTEDFQSGYMSSKEKTEDTRGWRRTASCSEQKTSTLYA